MRLPYYHMHERVWVLCKHCDSDIPSFLGDKAAGVGQKCPTCGSHWKQNKLVAMSWTGKPESSIEDLKSLEESIPKIVWLSSR